MMGVNMTKQQTGEIKNTKKSNLVDLNSVRKQPHMKVAKENFQSKSLKKIFKEVLFLVKLHYLVPGSFYIRKKPAKNNFHKILY